MGIDANPARIRQEQQRLGLNKTIGEQYRDWVVAAVHLDFGRSLLYDRPVKDLIPERAANTAILAVTALVVATLVGLPLGIITGSHRGGFLPSAVRTASLVLLSMPPLLTSLFLVFVAARTGWLPITGMRSAFVPAGGETVDLLRHLVVPAAAIGVAARDARADAGAGDDRGRRRTVRSCGVRARARERAWARRLEAGAQTGGVGLRLMVGTLPSGSFAVEVITAWPGLGRLTAARDIFSSRPRWRRRDLPPRHPVVRYRPGRGPACARVAVPA
jgi:peptide/nickel transport system permease protein